MAKLKLGAIEDDKSVRVTIDLPAALHRDLVAYAQALSSETAQNAVDPAKLIAPMLKKFMATDRAFAKLRRGSQTSAVWKGQRPPRIFRKLVSAGFWLSSRQCAE